MQMLQRNTYRLKIPNGSSKETRLKSSYALELEDNRPYALE